MSIRFFVFAAMLTANCSLAQVSYGQYPVKPVNRPTHQPAFTQGVVTAVLGQPANGRHAALITSVTSDESYVAQASILAGGSVCDTNCAAGCSTGCDGRCDGGCIECCDGGGGFDHCWYFYGEYLYLRPRDSEVAWASPIDGPIVPGPVNNNPIQIQALGVADIDFQPAWRGGFQYNFSECAAISAQYTMYEANTNDALEVTAPNVIRSLVSHPGTLTAAQDFLAGTVAYNINYDLVDIDYRKLLWYDCDFQVGYLAGVGIVQMEQTFVANFAGTGTEQVQTDIDFYGAGGRFGLFSDFQVNKQWRFYGKGTGNLIAGEFHADYDQRQSYDPQVVDTAWRGGRIIGIWDLETGLKWTSCCGHYSANVGYVYSAWTNTLQTDQWIQGVRNNSFIDMDGTMTFDGLVARVEARF